MSLLAFNEYITVDDIEFLVKHITKSYNDDVYIDISRDSINSVLESYPLCRDSGSIVYDLNDLLVVNEMKGYLTPQYLLDIELHGLPKELRLIILQGCFESLINRLREVS